MPQTSIIMPVYNTEKYLERAIQSVLNQTFCDFELICVNDGSFDGSAKILEKYAQKDTRIKVITQNNQGLSMARNNGVRHATGEYIYFLDSDDAIHPQLLEISILTMINNEADLVCFDYEKSDGFNYQPKLKNLYTIGTKITTNPLFFGCKKSKYRIAFNVWTKLYKKELIKDISFIPNIYFEDYPYTYAILSKKPKTAILNTKLVYYTKNENSISNLSIHPKHIKDYHTGVQYVMDIYSKPELNKEQVYLKRTFIPNILKQQLKKCQEADKCLRPQMFEAFRKELMEIKEKGWFSWRGHKFSRYLFYKKLLKQG